jgi:MSHA biogenesis protein MshE
MDHVTTDQPISLTPDEWRQLGYEVTKALENLVDSFGDTIPVVGIPGTMDFSNLDHIRCAYPIPKFVELVVMLAIADRASEVRFGPQKDGLFCVSYAVDGIFYELVPPPTRLRPSILQTIRAIAGMGFAKEHAKDGRFIVKLRSHSIDVAVAQEQTPDGETIVLRFVKNHAPA